jgi:hypothetical protein
MSRPAVQRFGVKYCLRLQAVSRVVCSHRPENPLSKRVQLSSRFHRIVISAIFVLILSFHLRLGLLYAPSISLWACSARAEVTVAVKLHVVVLCIMIPYSLVGEYQRFGGTLCILPQDLGYIVT